MPQLKDCRDGAPRQDGAGGTNVLATGPASGNKRPMRKQHATRPTHQYAQGLDIAENATTLRKHIPGQDTWKKRPRVANLAHKKHLVANLARTKNER